MRNSLRKPHPRGLVALLETALFTITLMAIGYLYFGGLLGQVL